MKRLLVILICMMFVVGCDSNEGITYKNISSEEAYNIMNNEDVIVLDVRTLEEFNDGHIKNAINIPLDELNEDFYKEVNDKDTKILVYCRSGNRSKSASEILVDLGYTNVIDFGGIINWPYGVVQD